MIDDIKKIGRLMFEEKLVTGGVGSFSFRQGDEIFTTKKGALLGHLLDQDIEKVGIEATDAWPELKVHLAIYKASKVQAIIHAYSPYANLMSFSEDKLLPLDAEGKQGLRTIAVLKARDPLNSDEMVKMLPTLLGGNYVAALVRGNGSFAVGQDLMEAYLRISQTEASCQLLALSKKPAPPPAAHQTGRSQYDRRTGGSSSGMRGPAIPPGIGVMDRSRYHKR